MFVGRSTNCFKSHQARRRALFLTETGLLTAKFLDSNRSFEEILLDDSSLAQTGRAVMKDKI